MLTIALNFSSVNFKNNILKYVFRNDKFFVCVLTARSIFSLLPENESDDFSVNEGISQKFYLLDYKYRAHSLICR